MGADPLDIFDETRNEAMSNALRAQTISEMTSSSSHDVYFNENDEPRNFKGTLSGDLIRKVKDALLDLHCEFTTEDGKMYRLDVDVKLTQVYDYE